MTSEWRPANAVELALADAVARGDEAGQYGALIGAELVLPISAAALAGTEPPKWATGQAGGTTLLLAFTSPEAMVRCSGGQATMYRTTPFRALAAAWPDPHWVLAVDPGLPVELYLESGTVARMAAPPLAYEMALAGHPQRWTPLAMQKALTFAEMLEHVGNGLDRVSGYVHRCDDTAHLDTPQRIVDGLGLAGVEGYLDDDGAAYLLRWFVVGPALYQSPYGGVDEEGMKAVTGWVVEEAPFVGTGFAPSVDQPVQEYKVDALRLPHGAEVYRVDPSGDEQRIALHDADLGRWLVVRRVERPGPSFRPAGAVLIDEGHPDQAAGGHGAGSGRPHRGAFESDGDPFDHGVHYHGGLYDP